MGTLDEIFGGDDDDSLLDVGWKSESEQVEELLEQFRGEPLEPEIVDRVRRQLDEAGIDYLRVIGEYDDDQRCGVIRVVLEDGTEVSIP